MAQFWHDHVHILSSNPARAAKFYIDNFGARLVERMPIPADGRIILHLEIKGTLFLIMKPPKGQKIKPPVPGSIVDHLGFRTNNINKAVKDMKARGVKVTLDVTEFHPNFFIAFIESPEGISIELVEDRR